MIEILNYINGELVKSQDGEKMDNINPATAEVFSTVPKSKKSDVDAAVESASRAFPFWSGLSNEQRSEWLIKMAEGIKSRFDEFALAETRDNGKPLFLSRSVDIPRSISNLKYFAKELENFNEVVRDDRGAGINKILHQPLKQLRDMAGEEDSELYVDATRKLFELDRK